jgi:branched-chain amino acid transport system permease protein
MLVASLGLYIVMQNLISFYFTDATKSLRSNVLIQTFQIGGARITSIQGCMILASIIAVTLLLLSLQKTRLGIAMRATGIDPELANVVGVDSNRIILASFALGSWLAGVTGILVALDVDMTPVMGMGALMLGVVAAIIGGVDNLLGVALGALLLGLAQNFGIWKLGSQWQDAIAFIVLLVFLLIKPEGFLGRKPKQSVA